MSEDKKEEKENGILESKDFEKDIESLREIAGKIKQFTENEKSLEEKDDRT